MSAMTAPACVIFGPVRHHQANDVAFANAAPQRPACVTVRAGGELAVTELLALGDQCRRIAESLGQVAHDMRENPGRMFRDRLGQA